MYDKSNPEDRLFHLEYLLYQGAVQTGYQVLYCKTLGKNEKMHILGTSRENLPNSKANLEILTEKSLSLRDLHAP